MIQSNQQLIWRRSKWCSGGNCVEVAKADGRVLVRNSDEPGAVVSFTDAEWRAFIDGADDLR